MSWKNKLKNKVVNEWFFKILYSPKFRHMTEQDRGRFMKFAEGFMGFVMGVANFLGLLFILTYIKNKAGIETALLVALTIIIISHSGGDK